MAIGDGIDIVVQTGTTGRRRRCDSGERVNGGLVLILDERTENGGEGSVGRGFWLSRDRGDR